MTGPRKAMIRAYMDRNAWQDLYDRRSGITAKNVERLRSAVRHREIDIAVSVRCLEETYARHTREPLLAMAEVRFIFDVAGSTNPRRVRLVKEPAQHVDDDIRAYAARLAVPSPYMVLDMSPFLVRGADYRLAEEFARATRSEDHSFYDFMDRQRRESANRLVGISFEDYFETEAPELARGLAEKARALSELEVRGVEGLLELRSVRMAVGSNLSLSYSQRVGNRAPQDGDWGDMFHAIAAAAADVFVTNDRGLAECLRRIPAVPIEIIDLKALFSRLRSPLLT